MNVSAKKIACREIWGGNGRADIMIEFGRFRGRLLSLPYESSGGGDIHLLSVCDRCMLSKIVIADVAGHGRLVSDLALELKNLLRQNLNEIDNSKLLVSLNDSLSHRLREGRFVTMVTATFGGDGGAFFYAYAGHPTILRYCAAQGDWQPLRSAENGDSGVPLGVIGDTEYVQARAGIETGDMLLFYTDGLLDVKAKDNGHMSAGDLIELCREVTPPQPSPGPVLTSLIERIERIGGFADDVTSLIVQVT